MKRRRLEALVEGALETLPARFKRKLDNIAVIVEDWPDAATLREMGLEPPDTLYGLYRGVDLTHRDTSYGGVPPHTTTTHQGPTGGDWPAQPYKTRPGSAPGIHHPAPHS